MTLDLHKTALVVIDPQVSFCDRGGAMDRQGRDITPLTVHCAAPVAERHLRVDHDKRGFMQVQRHENAS